MNIALSLITRRFSLNRAAQKRARIKISQAQRLNSNAETYNTLSNHAPVLNSDYGRFLIKEAKKMPLSRQRAVSN